MGDNETTVFIGEIRKDIQYIKEKLEDRFKTYDAFVAQEGKDNREFLDRIGRLESRQAIIIWVIGLFISGVVGIFFQLIRTVSKIGGGS